MAFNFPKKKPEGSEQMNPMEQESKMSVLGGLKQDAEKDMLSKLQGLQGGSSAPVASPEAGELPGQEPNPLDSLTEGMSGEEIQELVDRLLEKKELLEGKSVFKPEVQ